MYTSYELKGVYPIFKGIFNRETNHLLKKKEMKWFVLHRCNLNYISTTSFYPSSVPLQRKKTHLLSSLPLKGDNSPSIIFTHKMGDNSSSEVLSSLPLKGKQLTFLVDNFHCGVVADINLSLPSG